MTHEEMQMHEDIPNYKLLTVLESISANLLRLVDSVDALAAEVKKNGNEICSIGDTLEELQSDTSNIASALTPQRGGWKPVLNIADNLNFLRYLK